MPKSAAAIIDQVALLIVSGLPAAELPAAVEALGASKRRTKNIIDAARERIVQAASVDRIAAIGKAIVRLEDLYSRALKASDLRTALAAEKELNRLLDLKRQPPKKVAGNDELEAIARHLLSLALADSEHPLREHARLAAELIRNSRGEGGQHEARH